MSRAYDPKFKGVGQKPGEVEIWRIKKFDLEVVPKEQHGNFYAGDCYIVLKAKSTQNWDVHFWLGKQCTQDEAGTAAIKTVELDDSLGGIPVQYREIQDHESALFLSYFRNGIKYLQGGHSTGFNHVVDSYEKFQPRLFHCKGKRNVRCTEVKCIKESLNLGDVFILDLGLNILVWIPPEAGKLERVKGIEQAKSIRDQERAGRPKIEILDDNWNTDNTFWKNFGGITSVGWIKAPHAAGRDESYWREKGAEISLWKVSDESGKMQIEKIRQGSMQTSDLKSADVFILDTQSDVFVWIGKNSNTNERHTAQDYGKEYVKKQLRPEWTQIIKVFEGNEPQSFTQFFENWNTQGKTSTFKPKLFNVSNETGKLVVEEVEDYYQEDLDLDDTMILDALNVIYVWIGAGANRVEKEAAEETAKKYLETDKIARHKKAEIEILHQGKETPGFKKLFREWDDKLWAKKEKNYKNLRELLF